MTRCVCGRSENFHPWRFCDKFLPMAEFEMRHMARNYRKGYLTMSEAEIEKQIQEKKLNAPRVTPQDLENVIASEHYFTALDGIYGLSMLKDGPASAYHDSPAGEALSLLTFCILVLKNGFTVTGESACASPENFDAEIGRKVAREHAKQKLWPLLGYALKQRLFEQADRENVPQPEVPEDWKARLRSERLELDGRLKKLLDFIGTEQFKALPDPTRERLTRQADLMEDLSKVLYDRITQDIPSSE